MREPSTKSDAPNPPAPPKDTVLRPALHSVKAGTSSVSRVRCRLATCRATLQRFQFSRVRGVRSKTIAALGIAVLLAAGAGSSSPSWSRCAADPQTELFAGIVHGCELLQPSP